MHHFPPVPSIPESPRPMTSSGHTVFGVAFKAMGLLREHISLPRKRVPEELLCSRGIGDLPPVLDPSPASSHCLSPSLMPGTGFILPTKRLGLSQTSSQNGASAGLVGTVQVALWQPLKCSPSLHANSSLCPASQGQPFPVIGGMGDSVSDRRLQRRTGAGEAGL